MQTVAQAGPTSKVRLWGGWIISALAGLFLTFGGITKVLKMAPVVEASARLGLSMTLTVRIGVLVLILAALYVVPSTSILGAILLTGFLAARSRFSCALEARSSAKHYSLYISPCLSGEGFSCAMAGFVR
jgi:hypothetical protein